MSDLTKDPTQAEIDQRAMLIQKTWTPAIRRSRQVGYSITHLTLPKYTKTQKRGVSVFMCSVE
jgi:hypothetical protein